MGFDAGSKLLADIPADFNLRVFEDRRVQPLIEAALDETNAWHKRTRRLTAPLMMWFTTLMVLHRGLSIPDVFRVMVDAMRSRLPALRLRQVTPEALHHARYRLGWKPLQVLFEKLAATFTPAECFRGLHVWGIDGVAFKTPDTGRNTEEFGRPASSRGNTAFPQVAAVLLVETATHFIRDAVFGACTAPERPEGEALLKNLGPKDLVLMDRGFAAGWLFESFLANGVHFLCRIPMNWRYEVVSVLGPGDFLVRVRTQSVSPSVRANGTKSRRAFLLLRMVQYRMGRKRPCIRLLTELVDEAKYPARALAALYHERWECEVVYDEVKVHLVTMNHGSLHTPFRSKNPEGVRQEAYALLVAYNLVRMLMSEAGKRHDIPPREISFVETLRTIRLAVPRFQGHSVAERQRLADQLYQDIADCRLDRPRRPRSYPRKVKVKMSNFGVKRPGDKEERLDPREDLAMIGPEGA